MSAFAPALRNEFCFCSYFFGAGRNSEMADNDSWFYKVLLFFFLSFFILPGIDMLWMALVNWDSLKSYLWLSTGKMLMFCCILCVISCHFCKLHWNKWWSFKAILHLTHWHLHFQVSLLIEELDRNDQSAKDGCDALTYRAQVSTLKKPLQLLSGVERAIILHWYARCQQMDIILHRDPYNVLKYFKGKKETLLLVLIMDFCGGSIFNLER